MRIVIYAEKRLHSFPCCKRIHSPQADAKKKEKEQTFD